MLTPHSGRTLLKQFVMIMFLPASLLAQVQERVVDKSSWRNEPVKVVKLKTKGKVVKLGEKFPEGDDWLYGLAVRVRNVSDKPIARIEFELSFPRPEADESPLEVPVYAVPMVYGEEPLPDGRTRTQVYPGEGVDVKLHEANLPFIKSDLPALGYPERITHARIMLKSVTFDDGARWEAGEILPPRRGDRDRKATGPLPNRFKSATAPGAPAARLRKIGFLIDPAPAR